jgi:amidohydrolase
MAADAMILEHARRVRHRLHSIPELAYEEHETAALVRQELRRLGMNPVVGPDDAPTATVVNLGDSGPCVLLRADIDALPIEEQTGARHSSTRPGVMHACGHDGHTANLLAVAAALAKQPIEGVRVKLVFQPAEEGGGGGRRLVEAGVLDETRQFGPAVDAAFGLHGWPRLPVGVVSTKPGPLLAATDTFDATFVSTGGHAAFPHLAADPIAACASAVVGLQQVVSREFDPTDSAVLSVTRLQAGTAHNITPPDAMLAGTCRTLTREGRDLAKQALHRRLEAAAAGGMCDLVFHWHDGYPATVNDPAMADLVGEVAGKRFVPAARPTMGGEDFSYFLERVPGCFFLVGLAPHHVDPDNAPGLHTSSFDFNDDALAVGVETMLGVLRRFAAGVDL